MAYSVCPVESLPRTEQIVLHVQGIPWADTVRDVSSGIDTAHKTGMTVRYSFVRSVHSTNDRHNNWSMSWCVHCYMNKE